MESLNKYLATYSINLEVYTRNKRSISISISNADNLNLNLKKYTLPIIR